MSLQKKWAKTIGVMELLKALTQPLTREQIGQFLGLTERGVYRYFSTLKEAGIVIFPKEKKKRHSYCFLEQGMEVKITVTFANGEQKQVPLDQCIFAFLTSFFEEESEGRERE